MAMLQKLILVVAVTVVGATAQAAEQAWVTHSNENAKVLLGVLAKYSPETASQLGIDGYDEAIADFSRDLYEVQNADLQAAIGDYRQRLAHETDPKVRQDLDILIGAAQDTINTNVL